MRQDRPNQCCPWRLRNSELGPVPLKAPRGLVKPARSPVSFPSGGHPSRQAAARLHYSQTSCEMAMMCGRACERWGLGCEGTGLRVGCRLLAADKGPRRWSRDRLNAKTQEWRRLAIQAAGRKRAKRHSGCKGEKIKCCEVLK